MKHKRSKHRRSTRKPQPASSGSAKTPPRKPHRSRGRKPGLRAAQLALARAGLVALATKILSRPIGQVIDFPDSTISSVLGKVRSIASHWHLPDAEDSAMRGFYKALESFDPYPSIFAAFGHWVCEKVEFELLNLSALYNRGKVRDAFIRFVEKFGHHPTIKELAKFAKLNPHLIANVIHEVVEELGLCPKNNLLFKSLLDLMGMDPASAPPEQSARVERVDKVLKQMRPSDACLIVLKHTCECSEQEILSMIKELRKVCFRRRDADAVCACLDAFTKRHGFDIKLPWDVDLLEIKSRGRLAVRLCRARVRFAELLSHSS